MDRSVADAGRSLGGSRGPRPGPASSRARRRCVRGGLFARVRQCADRPRWIPADPRALGPDGQQLLVLRVRSRVGRYLPLIELQRQTVAPTHLALFAATLTVPVVASFRETLYWSVGVNASSADFSRLVGLTIVWPVAIVLVAASGYSSRRSRGRRG